MSRVKVSPSQFAKQQAEEAAKLAKIEADLKAEAVREQKEKEIRDAISRYRHVQYVERLKEMVRTGIFTDEWPKRILHSVKYSEDIAAIVGPNGERADEVRAAAETARRQRELEASSDMEITVSIDDTVPSLTAMRHAANSSPSDASSSSSSSSSDSSSATAATSSSSATVASQEEDDGKYPPAGQSLDFTRRLRNPSQKPSKLPSKLPSKPIPERTVSPVSKTPSTTASQQKPTTKEQPRWVARFASDAKEDSPEEAKFKSDYKMLFDNGDDPEYMTFESKEEVREFIAEHSEPDSNLPPSIKEHYGWDPEKASREIIADSFLLQRWLQCYNVRGWVGSVTVNPSTYDALTPDGVSNGCIQTSPNNLIRSAVYFSRRSVSMPR